MNNAFARLSRPVRRVPGSTGAPPPQSLLTGTAAQCRRPKVLSAGDGKPVWGRVYLPHHGRRRWSGMSHEPKSPSLGMISTATRTTATVSPLTPSPLNGSIVPNGSPAAQSAHSGFAAALRKLAKQAEEPRGKAPPTPFPWCCGVAPGLEGAPLSERSV
ncbi:hypothetical protein P4O66_003315 [Electrophorus voltai]|uniref:Uncharacterized protein n=1 Tax=Electrophorus voltai TaxID=2609070 RepID=A0AAD8YRJ9_9TELE|nr:hypothetical protein P4O66_003315 [Electrophorus voltai]